jgi:hypothetical protein
MTDRFPDHLASVVADVRAELQPAWQIAGIMKAVRLAVTLDQPRATTVCAAARAAADPKNRTPAVIAMDGDHWRAEDTPHTNLPPRRLPGIDDARRPTPDVARRGAAACREQLGDPTLSETIRREHEIAAVMHRVRALAPALTEPQRRRLHRALDAALDPQEAAS